MYGEGSVGARLVLTVRITALTLTNTQRRPDYNSVNIWAAPRPLRLPAADPEDDRPVVLENQKAYLYTLQLLFQTV